MNDPIAMPSAAPLLAGARFPLGQVVITPAATEWIPADVIARALKRHQAADWGDVGPGSVTAGENVEALRHGLPVFSFYFKRGQSFSIVTNGDRTMTRVSVPRDFCGS